MLLKMPMDMMTSVSMLILTSDSAVYLEHDSGRRDGEDAEYFLADDTMGTMIFAADVDY